MMPVAVGEPLTLERQREYKPVARGIAAARAVRDRASVMLALTIGVSITLCVYGYQFERSNHLTYLLDPLRHHDPRLLSHDWFTTQTAQYHTIFSSLARGLMDIGLLRAGVL